MNCELPGKEDPPKCHQLFSLLSSLFSLTGCQKMLGNIPPMHTVCVRAFSERHVLQWLFQKLLKHRDQVFQCWHLFCFCLQVDLRSSQHRSIEVRIPFFIRLSKQQVVTQAWGLSIIHFPSLFIHFLFSFILFLFWIWSVWVILIFL